MKVALVHDWIMAMRGGERCLEAFCELFPGADLYTLVYNPQARSEILKQHPIHTTVLQHLPFSQRAYRYYLPLFPLAIESFRFFGYDLILSSSHCVAKGIRIPPGACHISYIHTPMRYIWDQYEAYFEQPYSNKVARTIMRIFRPSLKRWDVDSSRGVYAFIANSQNVANRIQRYYNRQAHVIHPPVDFHNFSASMQDAGYYLMVTACAPYKRIDLAIDAFNHLKWPLRIIGSGQLENALKKMAGPTVEVMGWRSDAEVREHYAGCRALIFPGEEDFGIVPLEAMASGKPVIAYGKGGVRETVVPLQETGLKGERSGEPCPTGVFFYEQTTQALIDALIYFEANRHRFDSIKIREHVRLFGRERFKEKIYNYVQLKYQEFKSQIHRGGKLQYAKKI